MTNNSGNNSAVKKAQANVEITLLQVEADSMSSSEMYAWLLDSGLPHDVVIRLHDLIGYTKKAAGKVFSIGKIVLLKIIEFVKKHPFLVIGAGIGAVVGAAVAGMITSIPFLGQVLAPVALALGLAITTAGALAVNRIDKQMADAVKDFFVLITDVFNTIFGHVVSA